MSLKSLTIMLIILGSAKAGTTEELDRYAKCYSTLTGSVPKYNDPLTDSVRSGTISGIEACKRILSRANLVNGELSRSSENLEDGKKILTQLNSLHNSFFESQNKKRSNGDEQFVYDYNDRSYYLLQALLKTDSAGKPNYRFSKVFTDSNTYKAKRDNTNNFLLKRFQIYGFIDDPLVSHPRCGDRSNWQQCSSFEIDYALIKEDHLNKIEVYPDNGYITFENSKISAFVPTDGKLIRLGDYKTYNSYYPRIDQHSWDMPQDQAVQFGDLIGIQLQPSKSVPAIFNRQFGDNDPYYRHYVGPAYRQPYPFRIDDMYDNLGAGMLFTPNAQQSFQLDDGGRLVQNGVDQVPRQWTEKFFKDVLCRDVPVIRLGDASPHVEGNINNRAPFRNSSTCMRCHASIDNLAFISRNYRFSSTSPYNGLQVNHFSEPIKAHNGIPAVPDDFFVVRTGNGDFRFRDMYGKYHNKPLASTTSEPKQAFRQLGQYISQLDDSYACFTSKYFTYLTGIEVDFFDPGDPEAPLLSTRQAQINNYVYALGRKLKNEGDLRSVLFDIMASDLFLSPQYGTIPVLNY